MPVNGNIFELALYKLTKEISKINTLIITKKINSILEIKKNYLALKKMIEDLVPDSFMTTIEVTNIKCQDELKLELEKNYTISIQLFKSDCWGEFSKLTYKNYPEIYTMMTDQNGDLQRTHDNFKGTVASLDFHGYTQFAMDIKYNKTPLLEFGDILPQKIDQICSKCRCLVYEMEGDTIIILGPENPIYIFNAILSIIEVCRQKPFDPNTNPKNFHGLDIKNPMIKPFEMNVAVTSGGRVFINKNGHVIGSIIAETSRILKIVNTKKPNKSGIIISEKVYRKLIACKQTVTDSHNSIFNFRISDPFLVDVKGTRLNIREVYLEERKYIDDTQEYARKLSEEIKKKNPSKWNNILSYYINLILSCLNELKFNIQIGTEALSQDKIKKKLESKFYEWVSNPTLNTINDILKISQLLYNSSEEIRDVTAVYHEFIQENYTFIAKRLDEFYQTSLKKEGSSSISTKKILESYEREINTLKEKFPAKRIMGTILSNEMISSQMLDVPYIGKK